MMWLIWSMEHNAWWAAESGYTKIRYNAGRFSYDRAREIVASANKYCGDKPNEAMIEDEGS